MLFMDGVTPVLAQLDDGTTGDARKNGAFTGSGVDLAVDLEHDVHGTDFFDVLLLDAVQPQDLGIAQFLGLVAGQDGSRIVAAALGETGQAGCRTDEVVLDIDADGVDALCIVSARRGADDAEDVLMGRVDTERDVGREGERTDVQGRAVRVRDPVLLHLDQSLDGLDEIFHGDVRDAQTVRRVVHTARVAVRAEQLDLVVSRSVGLHALEDLLGIVEHDTGRVQLERRIRNDARVVPADTEVVLHDEHVVREDVTETEFALIGGLRFERRRFFDLDIQHLLSRLQNDLLLYCVKV